MGNLRIKSKWFFLMLAGIAIQFAGCGGSDYESTDEFLESLSTDSAPGEADVGTLPPVDEDINRIAKIRIGVEEYDMGVIAHDQLAHGSFLVHNDGDMPLKITRIDTTCACTQGHVPPERSVIQPGASTEVDVVVDPRRIPGFHSRKVLTITSTDIERPHIEVPVTAQVDPEYEIDGDEFDLGDVPKGERVEKRIRFRTLIDTPIETIRYEALVPAELKTLGGDTETRVEEVPESEWKTPGRKEVDLVFALLPTTMEGTFARYGNLITSIRGGINRYSIEFSGTVVAPYDLEPPFPAPAQLVERDGQKKLEARITVSAATPITVGTITPRSEYVTATVEPGASPNEAVVVLDFNGKLTPGQESYQGADVELTVDGKTYSELFGMKIPPMNPAQR
jgi:hypothetical protein